MWDFHFNPKPRTSESRDPLRTGFYNHRVRYIIGTHGLYPCDIAMALALYSTHYTAAAAAGDFLRAALHLMVLFIINDLQRVRRQTNGYR